MRRTPAWLSTLLLTPLLLGWSDPARDLAPCGDAGAPVARAPIDIVDAVGSTAEGDQVLRFQITFSRPLPVPDDRGRPLRVDVLLRDPTVPDVTVGPYLFLNRIVRFDTVSEAGLVILLLPERSVSRFAGGSDVSGDTLTLQFPARMVTPDPDLAGFDLHRLRWTVVARDGGTCDLLGRGSRPNRRLKIAGDEMPPSPTASQGPVGPAVADAPLVSGGMLLAYALAVVVGGGAGFAVARRRRRRAG